MNCKCKILVIGVLALAFGGKGVQAAFTKKIIGMRAKESAASAKKQKPGFFAKKTPAEEKAALAEKHATELKNTEAKTQAKVDATLKSHLLLEAGIQTARGKNANESAIAKMKAKSQGLKAKGESLSLQQERQKAALKVKHEQEKETLIAAQKLKSDKYISTSVNRTLVNRKKDNLPSFRERLKTWNGPVARLKALKAERVSREAAKQREESAAKQQKARAVPAAVPVANSRRLSPINQPTPPTPPQEVRGGVHDNL